MAAARGRFSWRSGRLGGSMDSGIHEPRSPAMPAESAETAATYTAARTKTSSPKSILDLYFLDARHKLLEVAAFLDRLERARAAHAGSAEAMPEDDFRLKSFKEALAAVAG